jgi:nicotinate-nucleotide pyrophosphorylase (carboxylating)
MLPAERTVLNVLQHMSGITTATRACTDLAGPTVRVAATRKTLFPYLDKMAVIAGGGDPHRWRLDDMFLIKDNHIRVIGIQEAVRQAREFSFSKKIEVEAETLEQAREAALAGADIIMLDNMTPDEVRAAIATLKEEGHDKTLFEASGMITKDNIKEYADTGVDIISLGSLTHSVTAVDMSLEIDGD